MGINSQLQAPVVLPPGQNFLVPTEQDSWAPQSVWTLWRKDKCTALAGIQTVTPRLASP
jgi:hypothetical protein